ncbi:MAG: restriction endonuclease subunit S [Desulfuromonadales bacterium]
MTVDTFITNFGHLADAPNGVRKLRELILQLAVQGKLVPQNPEDEPAEVLLERIQKEKMVNTARKGEKFFAPTNPVTPDEAPYGLPEGWEWTRLGQITEVLDRLRKPVTKSARKHGPYPYYGASGVVDYVSEYIFDEPLVLVGEDGAKWGRGENSAFPISGKSWVNNHAHVLRPVRSVVEDQFLVYVLVGSDLQQYITGMTVPKLNQARLVSIVIPLPPLEKQKRIVAKVDQLMALCDELEASQQKQQQGRVRLNNAALDALLTAREPDEFADYWQRISTNFDLLYDHPETIAKLRAAILQLAVQGKLVPQNPEDEPASTLLGRIRSGKVGSGSRRGGSRTAPVVPVTSAEMPYELPKGWEWVRLIELGCFLGGGTPSKQNASFWIGEIPWVSPKDMKTRYIADTIDHVSPEGIQKSAAKLIPVGSILMVLRWMILLHSFPVAKTTVEVAINQDMKALVCTLPDISEYVLLNLAGEKARILQMVKRSSHGTCRLDSDDISGFVVALPPLPEQHHIVAKVNQLMAQCGELEAKLNQTQQHSVKLMEATVRQLLVA